MNSRRSRVCAWLAAIVIPLGLVTPVLGTTYAEPRVEVSLVKIDPKSAKIIWQRPFSVDLRPRRLEGYPNAIVAFMQPAAIGENVSLDQLDRKVFFFKSKNGGRLPAFDTRGFLHPKGIDRTPDISDDQQLAKSEFGPSVYEERDELELPNRWRSYGVAGLAWRNVGENDVHFFRGPKLVWKTTLPEGAYNLENWKNTLIYYRGTVEGGKRVGTLCAVEAGNEKMKWSFRLPADVPDDVVESDVLREKLILRGFDHLTAESAIYIFGNGAFLALDPETGAIKWRENELNMKAGSKERAPSGGRLIDAGDHVLIYDTGEGLQSDLYAFDLAKKELKVLKKGLYYYSCPIFSEGFVFCFTQRPLR